MNRQIVKRVIARAAHEPSSIWERDVEGDVITKGVQQIWLQLIGSIRTVL